MFKAWDYVTYAVMAVSVALGIWAACVADTAPARIVSILTAVVFFAGMGVLICWRLSAWQYDYVTGNGLKCGWHDPEFRPDGAWLEFWSAWVIEFWRITINKTFNSQEIFKDKLAVFVPDVKLSIADRWVAGYNTGSAAVMCNVKGWAARECLFAHELSHFVLFKALDECWSEEAHHKEYRLAELDKAVRKAVTEGAPEWLDGLVP